MTAPPAPTFEPPVPNLPLLRKVLDHIDAHPEEWNQGLYWTATVCVTAYCIAGHAVAMTEGVRTVRLDEMPGRFVSPQSGRDWDTAAIAHLGLTDDEAGVLFSGDNTREQVQAIAESIAARAGERL